MVDEERIERLAREMEESNCLGGDFGSRYMVKYFAAYVNDWDLLEEDLEQVSDMLCCIHDGYNYHEGLIRRWNSDEEFNFFDKYGLLEDSFTEVEDKDGTKHYIRYFKKEFRDTFLEEDWYYKSLKEEAANWYESDEDAIYEYFPQIME